jgi:DNA-directed RNA polymerase specialized sigma24 family protein
MPDGGDHTTTDWPTIFAAAEGDPAALAQFEQKYRSLMQRCVLAVLHAYGIAAQEAEDYYHDLFLAVMQKELLGKVRREPDRKFRHWLSTVVRNFVRDRRRRARVRGAGRTVSSEAAAEAGAALPEPCDDLTADRIVQREWAAGLPDMVIEQIDAEESGGSEAALYRELRPLLLLDQASDVQVAAIAAKLGIAVDAVHKKTHKLRQRFRTILCQLVAETTHCRTPEEQLDEFKELFGKVRGDRRDFDGS